MKPASGWLTSAIWRPLPGRGFSRLRGVQFMTSGMIGELVFVRELAKQLDVDLRFINPGPGVREVFRSRESIR